MFSFAFFYSSKTFPAAKDNIRFIGLIRSFDNNLNFALCGSFNCNYSFESLFEFRACSNFNYDTGLLFANFIVSAISYLWPPSSLFSCKKVSRILSISFIS